MNIKNSNILRSWNMERIEYQRRYSKLHKDSVKNPEDRYILGQIHELKYILVSFFGLTEKGGLLVKAFFRSKNFIVLAAVTCVLVAVIIYSACTGGGVISNIFLSLIHI